LIENRVRQSRGRRFPISIFGTIRELRQALPDCEHTDDELERVIVANAVFAGVDIAFDRSYRDRMDGLLKGPVSRNPKLVASREVIWRGPVADDVGIGAERPGELSSARLIG
jgi:hypothetical protein